MREHRKPLIIRGARQTGKSRLIEEFGRTRYEHLIIINFEKEPNFKTLFDSASTTEIIRQLEIIKDTPIIPAKTLIFLDEIQECPAAITKLRYFYEEMPQHHFIAAGSLLEFVLEEEKISFPVGRVEFYYLFPLTFEEFLFGCKKERLAKFLKEIGAGQDIPLQIHEELRKILEDYFIIGGMPEVVTSFFETGQYRQPEMIKESIIETYRDDFKKYSKRVNVDNLDFIFRETPKWIGTRVNLVKMGEGEIRSRDASIAIGLLQRAMVLYRINRAHGVAFPLLPYKKAQPKLAFLDSGLVQYINHISKEIIQSKNYHSVYKGGFAEQFVAQELLTMVGEHRRPELFYWRRETQGSTAEVDFLFPYRNYILPLEVKAGNGSTLFSLHQFMARHRAPLAIRIYDGPLRFEELKISVPKIEYCLLSIPLYMVSEINRLLDEVKI